MRIKNARIVQNEAQMSSCTVRSKPVHLPRIGQVEAAMGCHDHVHGCVMRRHRDPDHRASVCQFLYWCLASSSEWHSLDHESRYASIRDGAYENATKMSYATVLAHAVCQLETCDVGIRFNLLKAGAYEVLCVGWRFQVGVLSFSLSKRQTSEASTGIVCSSYVRS